MLDDSEWEVDPLTGERRKKRPTELRNLRIDRVDLVSRASNRRRYLLWKSESGLEGETDVTEPLTETESAEIEAMLNRPASV